MSLWIAIVSMLVAGWGIGYLQGYERGSRP